MPVSKRCVVLGGSFNPPTAAHKNLLRAAMDYLNADLGLFVPSSDFYVSRKAARQADTQALSEAQRMNLLLRMLDGDMRVNICEYGDTSKGRTLKTLREIQHKHPGHEIWFVIGDDKFDIFHRWPTNHEILANFRLLWVTRSTADKQILTHKLQSDMLTKNYMANQAVMQAPLDTQGISSSEFWRRLNLHDTPGALRLLDPNTHEYMREIIKEMRS